VVRELVAEGSGFILPLKVVHCSLFIHHLFGFTVSMETKSIACAVFLKIMGEWTLWMVNGYKCIEIC